MEGGEIITTQFRIGTHTDVITRYKHWFEWKKINPSCVRSAANIFYTLYFQYARCLSYVTRRKHNTNNIIYRHIDRHRTLILTRSQQSPRPVAPRALFFERGRRVNEIISRRCRTINIACTLIDYGTPYIYVHSCPDALFSVPVRCKKTMF